MSDAEIRVGANVRAAQDEFNALGETASAAFRELGKEGAKVAARLSALDNLWDSPARLGKAAVGAKMEVEALAEAVQKAGAMTPKMAAAFDAASKKIDQAAGRARGFADVAADMKDRGELAAKGFEAASNGASSLEGILGQLGSTGGNTSKAVSDVGFAAVGVAGAFTLGYDTGTKFNEMLSKAGVNMAKLLEGNPKGFFSDLGLAIGKVIPIGGELEAKLRKISAETSAFAGLMAPLPVKINPVLDALHKAQKEAGDAAEGLGKLGIKLREAGDASTDMAKTTQGLQKWFDAHRAGSKDVMSLEDAIKTNKEEILKWRDSWFESGKTLDEMPPKLKLVVLEAERQADATDKLVNRERELRDGMKDLSPALTGLADDYKSLLESAAATGKGQATAWEDQEKASKSAINALAKYADQNGLAEADVRKLLAAQIELTKAQGNSPASLEMLLAALDRYGLKVQAVAGYQTEFGKALEKRPDVKAWIEDQAAAYDNLTEKVNACRAAERQRAEEAEKFAQAQREALDGISNGYIGVIGQAKVLTIEITKASKEALENLDKITDAFAKQNEKARDYAANIMDAYQSGFTSQFETMRQLSSLIQQFNELLMKNAGNSYAAGIRDLLKAFTELYDGVRMGTFKPREQMKV